jgi:hypothetical protein
MASNRTATIAFGGWLYSIAKWLPSVHHVNSPAWGFTQRWCQDFASRLRRPVTLIGFSEGANAVMAIAAQSSWVMRAVIHSCEEKNAGINRNCHYSFFCTLGDSTPTFDGTIATAERALVEKATTDLQFLKYQDFEKPTWFERNVLAPRKHIFHNVLPQLFALGV